MAPLAVIIALLPLQIDALFAVTVGEPVTVTVLVRMLLQLPVVPVTV